MQAPAGILFRNGLLMMSKLKMNLPTLRLHFSSLSVKVWQFQAGIHQIYQSNRLWATAVATAKLIAN